MVTMEEIARVVNNYAPRLDEVEKVKFSMFIHNQFAREENLNDLNLANEWNRFVSDEFACGACGEWSNPNSHNCSEETQLVTCANCLTDFSPLSEGYVSNSPHLGGTCAFCGECWRDEFIRRNARGN